FRMSSNSSTRPWWFSGRDHFTSRTNAERSVGSPYAATKSGRTTFPPSDPCISVRTEGPSANSEITPLCSWTNLSNETTAATVPSYLLTSLTHIPEESRRDRSEDGLGVL